MSSKGMGFKFRALDFLGFRVGSGSGKDAGFELLCTSRMYYESKTNCMRAHTHTRTHTSACTRRLRRQDFTSSTSDSCLATAVPAASLIVFGLLACRAFDISLVSRLQLFVD